MKKKSLIVSTVLLMIMGAPLQVVQGMTTEEVRVSDENETRCETLDTTVESISEFESTIIEEISQESEVISTMETVAEQADTDNQPLAKGPGRAVLEQDTEGFWLVDSGATLTELLKDSQRLKFRLTQDIDLGTAGYRLKNGVVIDGDNHKITYDKGGYYDRGFYIEQSNATVEIRNTQFGQTDGTKAVGYYGFLTGLDGGINMTFIFDNVNYYSKEGQMIYNRNGSIIMRGENEIIQKGTGTYAQEWAETNYVEIQNGTTTIDHSSLATSGFIWSISTNSGNPHANSSQVVVRKNAEMNIKTNASMTYDYLAPSFIVEENGQLTIDKVSSATGGARNAFFYASQTQKVTFDFQKNSRVTFILPAPINLGSASGAMVIGEGANVAINVSGGTIFTPNTASTFSLNLQQPEHVEFASTGAGTLGLNGGTTANRNLSFASRSIQKLETFSSKTAMTPTATILRQASDLRARVANYTNVAGSADPLLAEELAALSTSQKIVFSKKVTEPNQVTVRADQETATTAQLHASSFNNGSLATEVTWLLFASQEEANDLANAQQVVKQSDFGTGNTVGASTYTKVIEGLTPNTQYWLKGMVSNGIGQSPISEAVSFTTAPALDRIVTTVLNETSALITGRLLGATYSQVTVEYSKNSRFIEGETLESLATITGLNARIFTTTLTDLEIDTTYFVRIKAVGLSGEEVTLMMTPLTTFTTVSEIINVEIPIEMAFQTENRDLGTSREGQLYSDDYNLVNKGNVPTKISLIGIESQNEIANQLVLRPDLLGTVGKNELALQIKVDSEPPKFITKELENTPLLVGVLGVGATNQQQISLGGTYFNPTGPAVRPAYQLTVKVEINH